MRITLHNHRFIDSEEKPIIPNIEFKKLLDEVKGGNFKVYSEAKKKYSLIPFQHSLIHQAHERFIKKNN